MAGPDDTARYRVAAEVALQQVDVCINYLLRLQKRELATRLEKNRNHIAQLLARR